MPSVFKASVKRLRSSSETLLAVLSFGASSVYWMGLAFAMAAPLYGKMMTMQAAVLLVSTVFTCRTHDLVFFVMSRFQYSIEAAFRAAMRFEVATTMIGIVICAGGAVIAYPPWEGSQMALGISVFAILAGIGAAQGASIAKLRFFKRGDIISLADMLCIACWTGACASILLIHDRQPLIMLILGAAPTLARSLALVVGARLLDANEAAAATAPTRKERSKMLRFLAEGQVTNFLKNGAVSIETMILAAFLGPTSVAMYRLARAMLGAPTAAMNVSYQRAYPALIQAESATARRGIVHRLKRTSITLCLLMYPVSALVALAYSYLKPEIDIASFQIVVVGTVLALLPLAYQQGAFAVLSIGGNHKAVSTAYIISFIFLAGCATALLIAPRMEVFLIAVIGAAVVRAWLLEWSGARSSLVALPAD